jgi:hypothetical protein
MNSIILHSNSNLGILSFSYLRLINAIQYSHMCDGWTNPDFIKSMDHGWQITVTQEEMNGIESGYCPA